MRIEEIEPGYELPALERTTDPQQMKLMAALLQDPNPIHFDLASVESLGLGHRVITQGPMTLSFVAELLAAWAGGPEAVRLLRVRMLGNVFGGDTVTCTATVTGVDVAAGLVTLEVQAAVGERAVVAGTATVTPGA